MGEMKAHLGETTAVQDKCNESTTKIKMKAQQR
jgi:hypothetical protein